MRLVIEDFFTNFLSEQSDLRLSKLELPLEKYEELGKPTIMDTLNITVEFEPKEAKSKTTKDKGR